MTVRERAKPAAQREESPARWILAAAGIVFAGLVAGSLFVASALDRVADQLQRADGRLDQIRAAVVDARGALANLQAAAAPAAPRGPDPNRRHSVATQGSPTLGPQTAAVTIVEFSDFQ